MFREAAKFESPTKMRTAVIQMCEPIELVTLKRSLQLWKRELLRLFFSCKKDKPE